jgi:hypothetical protein
VLEGNNAFRGLARGGAQFAKSYGAAKRADDAAKRSMAQMEFHIADAERKERMGNSRAASAAVESARKDRLELNKAELTRDTAMARLATDMGTVNKPGRAAGAGTQPSAFNVLFNAKQALAADPKNPKLQAAVRNAEEAVAATKQSFSFSESGPGKITAATAPVQQRIDSDVAEALNKFKSTSADGAAYRRAARAGNTDEATRLLGIEEARLRKVFEKSEAAVTPPGGGGSGGKPKVIKLD